VVVSEQSQERAFHMRMEITEFGREGSPAGPNQALERTAQSRFGFEFRVGPSALADASPGSPGLSLSLIR
jgi:hypothetical protein